MHFTCYDIDYRPLGAGSSTLKENKIRLCEQNNQLSFNKDELQSLNNSLKYKPCDDLSIEQNYIPLTSEIFNTQKQNIPVYNSFLKPGAVFAGHQESGRQQYKVEVSILNIDMHNASLSGLLTIHNLTETHPVLTTYFDGEIVGKKYSFITTNQEWESSVRNDIQHWARFSPWRDLDLDLLQDVKNQHWYNNKSHLSDHIYMRWKEKFLYPNSDVESIKGASFAGFYYVCFNVRTGSITGLYFHKFTDRFQQLNLSHVPDMGVCQTYELC